MELPGNKRRVESFLNQFKKEYSQNVDPDGKSKEAALAYLNNQNLNAESYDDLSRALNSIMKDSDQLTTLMEIFAKQEDDPTAVSWLNERVSNNNAIKFGLIGLLLNLQDKN